MERRKISGLSSSSWSCLRTVQLRPVCSKCVFRLFIILFFEAITQVFGQKFPLLPVSQSFKILAIKFGAESKSDVFSIRGLGPWDKDL